MVWAFQLIGKTYPFGSSAIERGNSPLHPERALVYNTLVNPAGERKFKSAGNFYPHALSDAQIAHRTCSVGLLIRCSDDRPSSPIPLASIFSLRLSAPPLRLTQT